MALTMKRLATLLLVAAVPAGLAVRLVRRVAIEGASMHPTLQPGDHVVLLPARRVAAGDIVGAIDPRDGRRLMVKRVAACPGETTVLADGTTVEAGSGFVLLGDHPDASTDSRHFGPVSGRLLRGRVVYRYRPDHRRGRV